MENFKEILKDLIQESGLSLRSLEKASGVSAMQYSRYLKGSIPTINVVLKIAKYFNCSLDYLFGLDDNRNPNKYKNFNFKIDKFINNYQMLLKANNISHYKFAQNNNFNESIIRHWKAGKTPRLDIIYTIATKLGGSIDELIGRN